MDLMKIYKYLLRSIVEVHAKAPSEQLHLETGSLSIIDTSRMIYLQTILKKPEGELVRNIYMRPREMIQFPMTGVNKVKTTLTK